MKTEHSGRYELITRASKRFWEATLEGDTVTVHSGKIGTAGRTHKAKSITDTGAYSYLGGKVQEMIRKGYKPEGTSKVSDPLTTPTVITCTNVGEHVEEVAIHLCKWLTKCLKSKMPPRKFKKIWNEFLDGEVEDGKSKVPEFTRVCGEKEYWTDVLSFEEKELPTVYDEAVKWGADRFIIFNNNAFIDVVAIRGRPDPKLIALFTLVLQENVGEWTEKNTKEYLGSY